jgi:hypothetical protein
MKNIKARKRAAIQKWLDQADSAILNKNCPETLAVLESLTVKQMNALLKLVLSSYSSGYRDGTQGMRELLLKKHRTHHVLQIDSHSGNVSIYDEHGDFVDKVNNLDEADRIVNQRNLIRRQKEA